MSPSETRSTLPALPAPTRRGAQAAAAPGYAAQMLAQDGARRGLRGGAPVLAAARSAYLSTEWSGAGDRRLVPGALRRTCA